MGRPKKVTDEQILTTARSCFLERGASVSAVDIGRELCVSHTTIYNRFGSKKALMISALGPLGKVPWVAAIERGPDDSPIRHQLVDHCTVISAHFQKLQFGLAILHAAGITVEDALRGRKGTPPPAQAFRALTGLVALSTKAGPYGEVQCRHPGDNNTWCAAQLGFDRKSFRPFDDADRG
jgi:AcrR family transcriptional regulator